MKTIFFILPSTSVDEHEKWPELMCVDNCGRDRVGRGLAPSTSHTTGRTVPYHGGSS